MSTIKTIIGEKNKKRRGVFHATELPFIVQWCRNVRDAECPPDTLLRARGRVSSFHSGCHNTARLTQAGRGRGVLGEICRKPCSSVGHKRHVFCSSGQMIRRLACVLVSSKGHRRGRGRRAAQGKRKPTSPAAAPREARSSPCSPVRWHTSSAGKKQKRLETDDVLRMNTHTARMRIHA